jgi:hypothetical protein
MFGIVHNDCLQVRGNVEIFEVFILYAEWVEWVQSVRHGCETVCSALIVLQSARPFVQPVLDRYLEPVQSTVVVRDKFCNAD